MQRNVRRIGSHELTDEDHKLLADTAGLSGSLLSSNMSSNSHSNPVWPMLLMLLIALMSCELILSGIISHKRFGTEVIAETSEKFGEGGFGAPAFGQKSANVGVGRSPQKSNPLETVL